MFIKIFFYFILFFYELSCLGGENDLSMSISSRRSKSLGELHFKKFIKGGSFFPKLKRSQKRFLFVNVFFRSTASISPRFDEILVKGVPESVAETKVGTVIFLDIANSTEWTKNHNPKECFQLYEDLFGRLFDDIKIKFTPHVRFIETAGDSFVALVGGPHHNYSKKENEVIIAINAAKYLKQVASEVFSRIEYNGLSARIGLATGDLLGRITCNAYHLLGPTMTIASRTESSCPPGSILLHSSTFKEIQGTVSESMVSDFTLCEKNVDMKGLGIHKVYEVNF